MSIQKLTYADKQQLNANPSIADINKCQASDMNSIKSVVNTNADVVGDLDLLTTEVKTSIVDSINKVNSDLTTIKSINSTSFLVLGNLTQSLGTINGNSAYQITIETTKTGYTPLGILGVATNNQGIGATSWRNYSSSVIIVFRNFTSSSASDVTAYIRILYAKTDWSN